MSTSESSEIIQRGKYLPNLKPRGKSPSSAFRPPEHCTLFSLQPQFFSLPLQFFWPSADFSPPIYRQALRYIIHNTTLSQRTRAQAQLELSQMHCYTRLTQINNRCIEGGKSRGVLSDFRMSRVKTSVWSPCLVSGSDEG